MISTRLRAPPLDPLIPRPIDPCPFTMVKRGMIPTYSHPWQRWPEVVFRVCLFGRRSDIDFGEDVEAELVYLIRQGTRQRPGKWPVDRHEIQFRHRKGKPDLACLAAAWNIYRELVTGQRSR